VIHDNVLIGCIMLGDTKEFNRITKMMAEKQSVAAIKETILTAL
jgi:NAD(P)H-nitrite reductase large subunit